VPHQETEMAARNKPLTSYRIGGRWRTRTADLSRVKAEAIVRPALL